MIPTVPADFAGADLVWLLDLTWGGRAYRLATRPVDLLDADGASVAYSGGLEEPEWEESLDRLSTSTDGQSVAIEVTLQVDVATVRRQGHDLTAATATLAYVLDVGGTIGQTWERRYVVLAGRVVQPQYGHPERVQGWLAFSLEERPYDDRARVIPGSWRVTDTTWPNRHADALNEPYPLVFGTPGIYRSTAGDSYTTGAPALAVVVSGGTTTKLLVAGGDVRAATVRVYDADGNGYTGTVVQEADGLGQRVATVDVSAAPAPFDATGSTYVVTWGYSSASGGARNPYRVSSERTGAGDVCRWMLSRSTIDVDTGRWAAVAPALNRYLLSGYVNDPDATPWEWLADNVLPLLPLTIRRGPDGLYPVLAHLDAREVDAVPVRAGPAFRRSSPVMVDGTVQDVINAARLDYVLSEQAGTYKRFARIDPAAYDAQTTAETGLGTSLAARVSQARYGVQMEWSATSDIVYDVATAQRIVSDKVRLNALLAESVEYEADVTWGWLTVGRTLSLTDDDADDGIALTDRVCVVDGRRWTGTGWRFRVVLDEDLARDARST